MAIFEISKQELLLEGRKYSAEKIQEVKIDTLDSPHRDLFIFLQSWFDIKKTVTVQTSGSTGTPKKIEAEKEKMIQSARLTCEYLQLKEGDTALLCMNLRYIGAMMVVVRALVYRLNLIIRPASGHPLKDVSTPLHFAAMVPLQVYNTLQIPTEKRILEQTETLIIGGGAIDKRLEQEISKLPGNVYSTYGMTETLSHIALKRLNDTKANRHYIPFEDVGISISDEGCLVIDAPLICNNILYTNDIAQIYSDGSFDILGRKDNTIDSGGIKIQAEVDERILRDIIPVPFVITSTPDERLGEAVVLLIEKLSEATLQNIEAQIKIILPPYHLPQKIILTDKIPTTNNGKVDRMACRKMVLLSY